MACCLEGHKRLSFSYGNFPPWAQFKLVAFVGGSTTKILFHLGCYSVKKNKFPRLAVKKQVLVRQQELLGADSVSDTLKRGLVQAQLIKAKA